MGYKVTITDDYHNDVSQITDYYKLMDKEVSNKFLAEVLKSEDLIIKDPFLFTIREDRFRRKNLNIFPYAIFYSINELKKEIGILRCLHQHRDPNIWP